MTILEYPLRYVERENTLGAAVARAARCYGDNVFISGPDGDVTFHRMDRRMSEIAAGLRELGVENGDAIAVMMNNTSEYVAAWFGISAVGGVEVSLNTAFKGSMLSYVITQSDSKVVLCSPDYLDQVLCVLGPGDDVRHVVVFGGDVETDHAVEGVCVMSDSELTSKSGCPDPSSPVLPIDVAQLSYTSGTTGRSKGVMVPHNRILQTAADMVELRRITKDDVLYTCLPLFHGNAKYLTVMPALITGARVALERRFSASSFWTEIRESGATQFNYLGMMIAVLNKQPVSDMDRDHTAQVGWGAGAPRDITSEFERRFGVTLLEGYGLTEGGIPLSNQFNERRIGSCGKPLPGYQVKLVDEWDNEVPTGEVGEIVISPNRPYTSMLGYYNMPEATISVFRNLVLHTGDLARLDEDGFFHFIDRSKDAIRRRGENISSQEIEAIAEQHPAILESAAFPIPSDVTEDDVMLVAQVAPDAQLEPQELAEFCVQNMPYFWVPRYIDLRTEDLPRTPTNKVEKYKLRSEGVTSRTWDREANGDG